MRRSLTLLPTLVACILLLALPAASARANAVDDRIFYDCEHSATGALTGTYTKAQLNHALRNLPSDISEYSGCSDAIQQARSPSSGGGSGGGSGSGGGGSSPAGGSGSGGSTGTGAAGGASGSTPAAGGALATAQPPAGAEQPVHVAGASVAPGTLPQIGRDSHRLPTALVVLIALLAAAALVPATMTIGRRVVARRRA